MNAVCTNTAPIVAVDLDNVLVGESGGFDRIDIARFCDRVVAEVGRNCIIKVFANGMSKGAEAIWTKFGAQVIRTGENADPFIVDYLFEMERAHSVIIVSGDHAFAHAAAWHRSVGHHVSVWSRRARAAYELIFAADTVDFCIDGLLVSHCPASRFA